MLGDTDWLALADKLVGELLRGGAVAERDGEIVPGRLG